MKNATIEEKKQRWELGLQKIGINMLRYKNWLQSEMRVRLNQDKIKQYAREKKKGADFPAPIVFLHPKDEIYYVGDGFHRIEADFINGTTQTKVIVKPGGLKEAILFNLKANRENQGMGFAPGDISKSIKRLLTDKLFKGLTRLQISESVGCSYSLVSKVALKLGLPRAKTGVRPVVDPNEVAKMLAGGMTHQAVADKLGVSIRSVYRREISSQFEDCPHCHGSGRVLKEGSK